MQLTTVFTTFSSAEAHVVRSRLEAAGFTAQVDQELASITGEGYSMAAGGIQVRVPASQAEEAKALLSDGRVASP